MVEETALLFITCERRLFGGLFIIWESRLHFDLFITCEMRLYGGLFIIWESTLLFDWFITWERRLEALMAQPSRFEDVSTI